MPAPREPAPRDWTRTPARPAAAGFLGGAAVVGMVWAGVSLRPSPLPEPPPPVMVAPSQPDPSQPAPSHPAPAPAAAPDAAVVPSTPGDAGLPPSAADAASEHAGAEDDASEAPTSSVDRSAAPAPVLPTSPGDAGPTSAPQTEPAPAPPPAAITTRIRINTATKAQLELLPGIGPALAQRILDDRAANGPYRTIADLKRVRGIGDKTAAKLEPLIRFD